nr:MAG TPA: hypothetical protein [Caudoviricetes sp.]
MVKYPLEKPAVYVATCIIYLADPLKFRKVQSLITLRSRYKQQSSDLI